MFPKRIRAASRRIRSFFAGPHVVLFILCFVSALLFGLCFVWSMKEIDRGELFPVWVPFLFAFSFWKIVLKKPEFLLMLYHRFIWVGLKKHIKPLNVERHDPNKPHLRDGLITLIRTACTSGALISFLDFFPY